MALDATVGGPTANSYATRDEAVAYFADRLYASAWTALSDEEKDASLIMATRLIDRLVCFLGESASTTQALRFPMKGLVLPTGGVAPEDEIPTIVKDVVFELALVLARTDVTEQSEAAAQGLTKLKVGPIELGFKDMVEHQSVPDHIKALFPASWLCPTPEEVIETKRRKAEFQVL